MRVLRKVQFGLMVAALVSCSVATRLQAHEPNAKWSGFYAGLNGGVGWTDTNWAMTSAFYANPRATTGGNAGMFGGHAGVQHQWGPIVLGVEASYSSGSITGNVVGPVAAFPNDSFRTSVNDLFSGVGRLGFASNNMLFYGKGGFASGNVTLSGVSGVPVPNVAYGTTDRLQGWTAGAGVEWMLHRNLVLGLEYDYVDLAGKGYALSATNGGNGLPPFRPLTITYGDVHVQTVMARLSFKFGGDREEYRPLK